jgi:hypothetical protein
MSTVSIRAALETALAAVSPALATAWENVKLTPPVTSTAFQTATLMFAQPDNTSYGSGYRELGILQVDLNYPEQSGSSAAYTRAELLRSTFIRGATFSSGGISVVIDRTPEIMAGRNQGGRYVLPVRIRFFAQFF